MQVWLLTALSMVAISCATVVLVWAEGRVFGGRDKNIIPQTVMWVLKAFTQESESVGSSGTVSNNYVWYYSNTSEAAADK